MKNQRTSDPAEKPKNKLSRRQAIGKSLQWTGLSLALPGSVWGAFEQQQADETGVAFEGMPRARENRLDWEMLSEYITPQDQVFNVQHYGMPEFDEDKFTLSISGLVKKSLTLSMDQIRAMPQQHQYMTLECSGNGASKGFMDAIYNSKWTGTPLAPLLKKCGLNPKATEIVFYGKDTKEE